MLDFISLAVLAFSISLLFNRNYKLLIMLKLRKAPLNEFREKDSKLRNLQQYQVQLQEMQAIFNQQLEQLPKETEIPSLVEDINLTGVNSGLEFKNIRLEDRSKAGNFY